MIKLQEPKYVFMGGGLRLWKEATLHVGCEAVTRSLNVFEGLKGYWKPDGPFGDCPTSPALRPDLRGSARFMHSIRKKVK